MNHDNVCVLCAYLSKLAYYDPVQLFNDIYTGLDVTFVTDTRYDAQAYCWNWNDMLFVVFRGTSSSHDIRIDIDLRLVSFNPNNTNNEVKVHNGFLKQFNGIKSQLDELLTNHIKINKIRRIIFTGHSLGGALATLAAYHYASSKLNDNILHSCITFGSPKVGNKSFSHDFDSLVDLTTSDRFENKDDVVCWFPLHYPYTHVGKCSQILFCQEVDVNTNTTIMYWFRKIKLLIKQIFENHSIDGYITALLNRS